MQTKRILETLTYIIATGATGATLCGIASNGGTGPYKHVSIRGDQVLIYGKGIYRHMSAEVAPQGIAQDYVTLFVGVPLLLVALYLFKRGKRGATPLLAGVLGYFLVTYFFYLLMGMFNALFLLYVLLAGVSFFAVYLLMGQLLTITNPPRFRHPQRARFAGLFLMVNAVLIALLWLSIVVPPLLQGRIIPKEVAHYTTLVVQGLDLAILLPASFIVGWHLRKLQHGGVVWGPVYLVFLSLLMTALTAKVVGMGMLGYSIFPAVFLIPTINIIAVVCTIRLFQSISVKRKRVPVIIA
jgi:hypothetical protein